MQRETVYWTSGFCFQSISSILSAEDCASLGHDKPISSEDRGVIHCEKKKKIIRRVTRCEETNK